MDILRSCRSGLPALALVLPVFAASLYLRRDLPLNHDVAWLLVAAHRMAAGGTYLSDFFEINTPLAIALYLPPLALQGLGGLPVATTTSIWTAALILQSLLLIAVLGRRSQDAAIARLATAPGLAWLAVVLVLLPAYDFGQREHLATVLFLPFLVMLCAGNASAGIALRSYVSVIAAIGFLIKPHYAALPMLLLGLQARRQRSLQPLRGIEALALLLVTLGLALSIALRYRGWLACAQWTTDLYGAYHQPRFGYLLDDPLVMACAPLLLILGAFACTTEHSHSLRLFLWAAVNGQ
jgi:hypothetical protein